MLPGCGGVAIKYLLQECVRSVSFGSAPLKDWRCQISRARRDVGIGGLLRATKLRRGGRRTRKGEGCPLPRIRGGRGGVPVAGLREEREFWKCAAGGLETLDEQISSRSIDPWSRNVESPGDFFISGKPVSGSGDQVRGIRLENPSFGGEKKFVHSYVGRAGPIINEFGTFRVSKHVSTFCTLAGPPSRGP